MRTVLFLIGIISFFTVHCLSDPCQSDVYKILKGEAKRSSNYTLTENDIAIEDSRLTTGWYRIDSVTGNDIVNFSVSMLQCGTLFPLWMIGTVPQESNKTENRTVCRSGLTGTCVDTYSIQVRNCGAYRVYYLPQLNVDKSAYCFGTLPITTTTTTDSVSSSTSTTNMPSTTTVATTTITSTTTMATTTKASTTTMATTTKASTTTMATTMSTMHFPTSTTTTTMGSTKTTSFPSSDQFVSQSKIPSTQPNGGSSTTQSNSNRETSTKLNDISSTSHLNKESEDTSNIWIITTGVFGGLFIILVVILLMVFKRKMLAECIKGHDTENTYFDPPPYDEAMKDQHVYDVLSNRNSETCQYEEIDPNKLLSIGELRVNIIQNKYS